MATPHTAINQTKQEAFVQKVLGDTSATMTILLASIGDRLGLFKDLAANGPGTSAEIAASVNPAGNTATNRFMTTSHQGRKDSGRRS